MPDHQSIQTEMGRAAKAKIRKAARLRDQIKALEMLAIKTKCDYDKSSRLGYGRLRTMVCGANLFKIRIGKSYNQLLLTRHFYAA